jgi:hypothetical protein
MSAQFSVEEVFVCHRRCLPRAFFLADEASSTAYRDTGTLGWRVFIFSSRYETPPPIGIKE